MEILALALGLLTETPALPQSRPLQLATTCFGKGEQTSGMNKICYYDCLGSTVAINIPAYQICPITIEN